MIKWGRDVFSTLGSPSISTARVGQLIVRTQSRGSARGLVCVFGSALSLPPQPNCLRRSKLLLPHLRSARSTVTATINLRLVLAGFGLFCLLLVFKQTDVKLNALCMHQIPMTVLLSVTGVVV